MYIFVSFAGMCSKIAWIVLHHWRR